MSDKSVILDLCLTSYLDRAAAKTIYKEATNHKANGKDFFLIVPSEKYRELLKSVDKTNILQFFESFQDLAGESHLPKSQETSEAVA